uniref:Uncharacterized protein n=1 Tax=Arundo donax TaxID=35708 RepID=A0A0A9D3Q9_ARUDO
MQINSNSSKSEACGYHFRLNGMLTVYRTK